LSEAKGMTKNMKIKAAIVHEKGGKFSFEEVDLREPNGDEVLVKIIASGICHTDEAARNAEIPVPFPIVLGHEGAGIVEKVGSSVSGLEVGDHVVFSFAHCNSCNACHSGRPYSCEKFNEINFMGKNSAGETTLHQNGKPLAMFFGQSSFATHATINQAFATKVDKDVDLDILSTLGCGIQTGVGTILNTLRPKNTESIAVFGCGGVGLSAVMGAKIAGCKTIIAVGGNNKSLALALELGATHTINRKMTDDISGEISKIVNGGVNYAIDTSGNGQLIEKAIKSTCFYGKVILLAPSGVIKDFNAGMEILLNMRTLQGGCEGESVPKVFLPQLVQYIKDKRLPLEKIVVKYPFHDIAKAFDDSLSGRVIKAVVTM
jgi:aryl-alcohol dehydrogenase